MPIATAPPAVITYGAGAGTGADFDADLPWVGAQDTHCLFAQYRFEIPLAGARVYNGGTTAQTLYRQPGLNFTGQYYTLHRHYDPFTMRFTSPDPIASPWWNLHGYVGNNPAGAYDPDGLEEWNLWGVHISTDRYWSRLGSAAEGMAFGAADAFTFGQYFDDSDRQAMYWSHDRVGNGDAFGYGHATGVTLYVLTAAAATGCYAASATPGLLAAMASIGSPGAVTAASLGTGGLLVGGMVGGALGGGVGGAWMAAVDGGSARDIATGAGTGIVFGGALGFAGEAGGIGLRHLRLTRTHGGQPFERQLEKYLRTKIGETVIRTQRGNQGFDSVSFAGRGANARLFINEAKNYAGAAKSFSAVTTKFQRNLGWASKAIERSAIDPATKRALLKQLEAAPVRLWGNGARGTKFTPSDIARIGEAAKRPVFSFLIP